MAVVTRQDIEEVDHQSTYTGRWCCVADHWTLQRASDICRQHRDLGVVDRSRRRRLTDEVPGRSRVPGPQR